MVKGILFGCLWIGFILLFYRVSELKLMERIYQQTKSSMEASARQRLLANRSNLQKLHKENSLWFRLERELHYSGYARRFPGITVEKWLVCNLLILSVVFCAVAIMADVKAAFAFCVLLMGVEWSLAVVGKIRMLRSVNQNLLKFLDFLGNYSITAGEVTGVFNQISRYLEEPLKSALDECYLEAGTTGDVGMALLSMAEKIEHPKFKELVQNIEISSRYCVDFKTLVTASRRSVREYLRMGEERKGMLREAVINMSLLLLMSGVILLTVDGLIGISIWTLLFHTFPGKLALLIVAVILLLFGRQAYKSVR